MLFDSTVSVGQLQARPGQELYEALENRAANYFETGSGEVDLAAAFRLLKERQRSVEREVREQEAAREKEQEKVRLECRYLEQDMRALQDEYEEKRGQLEKLGNPEETEAARDEGMGAVGVLAGAVGFLWSLFLENAVHTLPSAPFAGVSAVVTAVGILLLAAGTAAAVKARRSGAGAEDVRPGEKAVQRKTEGNGKSRAEGSDKNQAEARRIQGEMDHIRSAWKEKEIRCANLREWRRRRLKRRRRRWGTRQLGSSTGERRRYLRLLQMEHTSLSVWTGRDTCLCGTASETSRQSA